MGHNHHTSLESKRIPRAKVSNRQGYRDSAIGDSASSKAARAADESSLGGKATPFKMLKPRFKQPASNCPLQLAASR